MSEFEEERFSKKVWPENRISELIRILEPLCIEYVKATHILHDLPFLRAHAGFITKAERRSAQEGTKLLLELIKDSDEPEKWKTFTLALKRAEFLSLYKVCHVCEKNDDFDFYIDIFELLSMDFASNGVDIVNLSQGMLQSESLTKEQFEQINFVLKEEGEIAAILEFFSCLPSSLEIWLKALQSCLFVLNKGDLYKLIQKKGAEIDSFKNIDLGPLVKIYYNTICERVRPQDIKAYLNPYNLIPDMNVNSLSPCEEMRRILENIDRSKVDGKWRSFLNALKQTGYESLHTKLTNEEENIDDSQQMCILKNVTPEILKSLTICDELLSEVKRDKLINERCYQEIKKKKQDSGEIAAAEMLLENIPRFKDGWFKRFLQILTDVGQRNVVRKIDPDFRYESLHTKLTNEEENIDDSQQMCILKNVTPEILKSLTICDELLSEVKRDKLINERCYQEIKKKKQDSGEIAAAEMLLENIPRFKDGWFKRFLQILTDVGQRNVVKKIDPDFQYFSDTGKVVEVEGKSC